MEFALNLLNDKKVLIVHGSGFSKQYGKSHFTIVYLSSIDILKEAFDRIESFINK